MNTVDQHKSCAASVTFVCEAGRLEAQALLLAASLRAQHPDVPMVAAVPGSLPVATLRALDALAVERVAISNPLAPDYPIGHKLAALAAGWTAGRRVFLDSDMLCLCPIDWAALRTHQFSAKPADVASFGDAAQWQTLYARFGLPAPAARIVTTVGEDLAFPYFNAGMLATADAGALSAVWVDACRAIDGMADIRPRRPWLDQIGLPLAIGRLGLSVRALGEDWNYPAHIKPLRGVPTLVHYHLPSVVARERALLHRVAALLDQYPDVAAVIRADAAWARVVRATGQLVRGRSVARAPDVHADSPVAGAEPQPVPRPVVAANTPTLLITGIPRSGTSYFCKLLDTYDNAAVVNEPQALFEGLVRSADPWAIPLLCADLRARIGAGEAVANKLDGDGLLAEDTARSGAAEPWHASVKSADWVLATKNTLAYLARLDGILRVMPGVRLVALVRHPLDTLASWKASFLHLAEGDPRTPPVGGLSDPFLPSRLHQGLGQIAALPDAAVRRAAWWRLLAAEILAFAGRIEVIRYEDLVVDPNTALARALGPLVQYAGRMPQPLRPSSVRTAARKTLDRADWESAALLCAGVAEAFGYDFPAYPGHVSSMTSFSFTGTDASRNEPAAVPAADEQRAPEACAAHEQRHALVGRHDLWRMKRAFQIDFLRAQGLRPEHAILDIGCGSLRGGAALIAYLNPGRYTGFDVRENVLAEARHELLRGGLASKRPTLTLADDMTTLNLMRRFDVLWAFSVLFHLADPILDGCFAMAVRHLQPHGVFFANVILGAGSPGEWQGFPVKPRSLSTYEKLAQRHGLHLRVVGTLADLGHHSGDPSQDGQTMLAIRRDADAFQGTAAPELQS